MKNATTTETRETGLHLPGHDNECICTGCLSYDMANHLRTVMNLDPAKYGLTSPPPVALDEPHNTGGTGTGAGTKRRRRTTKPRLATEKQIALIHRLRLQMPTIDAAIGEKIVNGLRTDGTTAAQASEMIDRLLKSVKEAGKTRETVIPVVGEGMYRYQGQAYKVQRSGSTGRVYALHFDVETMEFEFAPGIVGQLTEEHRMTIDEARELGRETGTCCVCAKELTNPASIEAGIGPICARRF